MMSVFVTHPVPQTLTPTIWGFCIPSSKYANSWGPLSFWERKRTWNVPNAPAICYAAVPIFHGPATLCKVGFTMMFSEDVWAYRQHWAPCPCFTNLLSRFYGVGAEPEISPVMQWRRDTGSSPIYMSGHDTILLMEKNSRWVNYSLQRPHWKAIATSTGPTGYLNETLLIKKMKISSFKDSI